MRAWAALKVRFCNFFSILEISNFLNSQLTQQGNWPGGYRSPDEKMKIAEGAVIMPGRL